MFASGTPHQSTITLKNYFLEQSSFAQAHDPVTYLYVSGSREGVVSDDLLVSGSANENLRGYAGNDELIASGGRDRLFGGAGADTLWASNQGGDSLFGGSGDDVLLGGSAVDTLTGGTGDDTLSGGAGRDRFEFSLEGDYGPPLSFGDDVITDFGGGDQAFIFTGSSSVPSFELTHVDDDSILVFDAGTPIESRIVLQGYDLQLNEVSIHGDVVLISAQDDYLY